MHFGGNAKSNEEGHPTYIPTTFDEVYRRKPPAEDDIEGYQRSKRRAQSAALDGRTEICDAPTVSAASSADL